MWVRGDAIYVDGKNMSGCCVITAMVLPAGTVQKWPFMEHISGYV